MTIANPVDLPNDSGPQRGPKGVIVFDFDGTLADTMPALTAAAVTLLHERYGLSIDTALNLYQETAGAPFEVQVEAMFEGDYRNPRTVATFAKVKKVIYQTARAMPGAREALEMVNARGYIAAVVSSTETDLVAQFVKDHLLNVKAIYGRTHGDDKADQIQRAAEAGKVVAFIGDSPRDQLYARRAEVKFEFYSGYVEPLDVLVNDITTAHERE